MECIDITQIWIFIYLSVNVAMTIYSAKKDCRCHDKKLDDMSVLAILFFAMLPIYFYIIVDDYIDSLIHRIKSK